MLTCAGHFVISLLTSFKKRQLILRGWIPYDYSSFVLFCLTYTHQYVGVISASLVNVACDSLIVGLLLHLCCQIMILQYRFKGLITGQNTLDDCVRQHHHIIEFAYTTNEKFTRIIAFQFVASTFVVCSNLYQLTRAKLIVDLIILFAYTICVLVQIFIYCWFGNKLKLMSLQLIDSIFEIEWIALDHKTKKSLLIIMIRAMKPIEFHSAYIFNMNLNSFVALLKTSYSVYNLLIQIQE
ncbi:PREDICTED: putative odorant receptor 85d [Atta colombica]|uniref:putative odorant receptor 85d n=1 Tax=Atta colombica TaxID=520822 RepID=UPI00084BC7C8|nr:PREDICTED: putative odorant receptor 85d [Atta colombica]